jgi:hypothetical protein
MATASLAQDLAAALDPAFWAARVTGWTLDAWQASVLRATAPQSLLNCSRQSGKTGIAACAAVHTALYAAPALVLVLSPSLRQSQEAFRKCLDVYRAVATTVPAEAESSLRLELTNGSRIVSLPGAEQSVRGYSAVTLLLVDEAARVSDELYHAVRPMLAVSGGRLMALSTPWGCRGWWWDAWQAGADWARVEVPATACPRIPARFLAQERASLPAFVYRQEYECAFEQNAQSVFRADDIAAALTADVTPLFGAA